MTNTILAYARDQLVMANRILAFEGVIDDFGHVSVRHPLDPGRYIERSWTYRAARAGFGGLR